MAYIYQIVNDINNKIYIGKTEFSIEKRFKEHCQDAFRRRNEKRPLYSAMRKYGIEHFHIELIEETDNPEEREIYWIEQKHSFKEGYNATLGGDGKRYLDYDLIIATYKELKSETKTAEVLKINIKTVKAILEKYKIEIYNSKEVIKQQFGIAVKQLNNENNELIQIFPTAREAAKFICPNTTSLGGVASHILDVCKGKRKTAYGYKWEYAE